MLEDLEMNVPGHSSKGELEFERYDSLGYGHCKLGCFNIAGLSWCVVLVCFCGVSLFFILILNCFTFLLDKFL